MIAYIPLHVDVRPEHMISVWLLFLARKLIPAGLEPCPHCGNFTVTYMFYTEVG